MERGTKTVNPLSTNSNSLPNAISSFTLQDQLMGRIPSISASYTRSKVSKFDPISTYIDCVITSGADAGLPEPCTLQFNSTVKATRKVISQLCPYSGTSLNPNMTLCTFPTSFSGLQYFKMSIKAGLATSVLTIPQLDDTEYNVCPS